MISPPRIRTDWFSNTRADVLAGIVVALALIPEAIGFSIIAGVDPKVGLYASVVIAIVISFAGGRPVKAARQRRMDAAAAFVAQYDQQRNVQMLGAVFQASDFSVCRDVARDAHDKQIAEALIKNDLRRHARISTTEHLGMRMLSGN